MALKNNYTGSTGHTTVFHERIDGMRDVYRDDPAAFGRIMLGLWDYAIDNEVVSLDDKHENNYLKQLRSMVDLSRDGSHKFNINQTINSNLQFAVSEDDMRERLVRKGFSEEEVQLGIDRFHLKHNKKDAVTGLNLNKNGQLQDWPSVDRFLGTDYSKR